MSQQALSLKFYASINGVNRIDVIVLFFCVDGIKFYVKNALEKYYAIKLIKKNCFIILFKILILSRRKIKREEVKSSFSALN